MTWRKGCLDLLLAVALAGAAPAAVAEPEPAAEDGTAAPAAEGTGARPEAGDQETPPAASRASGIPVYVRPRGAAGGREGGGTRGRRTVELIALIPEDHAALTTREQPRLYWYLSEATAGSIDVIVNRSEDEEPLVEKRLAGPFDAGIHRIDFASLGIRLEPGVDYAWYVQLGPDAARRAGGSFSGGTLQRVAAAGDLAADLARTQPAERAAVFAAHGIWCDALDEISTRLAARPDDATLRRQRDALLGQIGLARVSTAAQESGP
jgi:hypothetical protein